MEEGYLLIMYVHIYTYIYIYIWIHLPVYICIYAYTCLHNMYIYIYVMCFLVFVLLFFTSCVHCICITTGTHSTPLILSAPSAASSASPTLPAPPAPRRPPASFKRRVAFRSKTHGQFGAGGFPINLGDTSISILSRHPSFKEAC